MTMKPFAELVLARADRAYVEDIPMNHWSVGVRLLPRPAFEKIVGRLARTSSIGRALQKSGWRAAQALALGRVAAYWPALGFDCAS